MSSYGHILAAGNSVYVSGTGDQLQEWATRPGNAWPCSQLARLDRLNVTLDADTGDLIDLDALDIPADEFNAWLDDVLLPGLTFAHLRGIGRGREKSTAF